MKRKTLFTLFAVMCAALVVGQNSNYTAVEAAKHVGETATVTGAVDAVHQSGKGNIFLNMGGKYPNQAFTVFRRAHCATIPRAREASSLACVLRVAPRRGNG